MIKNIPILLFLILIIILSCFKTVYCQVELKIPLGITAGILKDNIKEYNNSPQLSVYIRTATISKKIEMHLFYIYFTGDNKIFNKNKFETGTSPHHFGFSLLYPLYKSGCNRFFANVGLNIRHFKRFRDYYDTDGKRERNYFNAITYLAWYGLQYRRKLNNHFSLLMDITTVRPFYTSINFGLAFDP